MDCRPLLGGGYISPRAAASCALCCASAFVGLPRFFLLAGSPVGAMVDVYAGPAGKKSPGYECGGRGCSKRPIGVDVSCGRGRFFESSGPGYNMGAGSWGRLYSCPGAENVAAILSKAI
jgi:hypothetical protein